MKENWVKIFSSKDLLRVKMAEDVLKKNNIVSHIANKPDSAMPMLSEATLYALPDKAEEAVKVLRANGIE